MPGARGAAVPLGPALSPTNDLAAMYRERWANDNGDREPTRPLIEGLGAQSWSEADSEATACLPYVDVDLEVKTRFCGELSFDSTDEMVRAPAPMIISNAALTRHCATLADVYRCRGQVGLRVGLLQPMLCGRVQ